MSSVILIHGTGGSPDNHWFPYLQEALENVTAPALPNPDTPSVERSVPFLLEHCIFGPETIMIGHSSGCPLILSVLERIDTKINKIIFVGGFMSPIADKPNPVLQDQYDAERIKAHCSEFIFINSDNDPWNCDVRQGNQLREAFGGTQITMTGEGHFGSGKFNQPYPEFPLLLKLISD